MTKYFVITCGSFQGTTYYKTEIEAQAAAERRHNISGQNWQVKEVWLYDPYADDQRPYRKGIRS